MQFEHNVKGTVEHFDVYGEVRTDYSEVYWTRNLPIDLPPALVWRFKDKVMVITGYEVDQVTHSGAEPNSTTSDTQLGGFSCYPSCDDSDASVPIYNAYNHHYFAWLTGADAQMLDRAVPRNIPNPTTTDFRAKNGTAHAYPVSIVFKENPGGEFRKSYHGYPAGFGQLLHSPTQWVVEPMQIDTHNRNFDINDLSHGNVPYVLPRAFTDNNMTDLASGLSPLIECPCTDRISKSKVETPVLLTQGTCGAQSIVSESQCVNATKSAGIEVSHVVNINDASRIAGCSIVPDARTDNAYQVVFNADDSQPLCGKTDNTTVVGLAGSAQLGNLTSLELDFADGKLDSQNITIVISGPSTVWFGVGFDAATMAEEPYAIIVDGNGAVTERKLGEHSPGPLLKPTVSVLTNSVTQGIRTVVMTRPLQGMPFCSKASSLSVITAVGSTVELSYHAARTGASILLLPTTADACVCEPNVKSYLTYMQQETSEFSIDCVGEPRSDMAQRGDGTGREGIPNAACDVETANLSERNILNTTRAHGQSRFVIHKQFIWMHATLLMFT